MIRKCDLRQLLSACLNLIHTSFYGTYFKHCLFVCQRLFSPLCVYRIHLQAGFVKLNAAEISFSIPFPECCMLLFVVWLWRVWPLSPLLLKGRTVLLVLVHMLYCIVLVQFLWKHLRGLSAFVCQRGIRWDSKIAVASCLPCVCILLSATCLLTIAAVEVGGLGSVRHSQADILSPEVSCETGNMKKIYLQDLQTGQEKTMIEKQSLIFARIEKSE